MMYMMYICNNYMHIYIYIYLFIYLIVLLFVKLPFSYFGDRWDGGAIQINARLEFGIEPCTSGG